MRRSKEDSLNEFRRTFESREAFLWWLWKREGDACHCGSKEFVYAKSLRWRFCEKKHRKSVTADTLFEHCKALLAMAMALWLAADGILISGKELSRLTGIEVSSAWGILKKIAFLALLLIKAGVKAPSEVFAFIIGRRSIETPKQRHPRAELYSLPKDHDCDPESRLQQAAITRTTDVIHKVHQRVSRKYLQLFAATMVFVHEKLDFVALMNRCRSMQPIDRTDILLYVSPPNIQLIPVPGG